MTFFDLNGYSDAMTLGCLESCLAHRGTPLYNLVERVESVCIVDVYDEIVSKADRLSVAEKVRLLEHLSTALRHDLEVEAFQRMPWREFIERTAGILSDDPIERPPQPPLEEREMLE